MLFSFNFSVTGSVICPENISMTNKAWYSFPRSSISRSFSTRGVMISSIRLSDSGVLLKCFSLGLNEKESGDFILGRLLWVFPSYISCMEGNLRLNVIPNVAVMDFLNDRPLTVTRFDPLGDSFWLATDEYLSGLWSKDGGMEWRSTRSTIWCWNISLVSFFARSRISRLDVVHVPYVKPMCLNRL